MDYAHQPLNQEIRSIGGRYVVLKEELLKLEGREILYHVGCAVTDSSCCGPAGCAYALVQGFVHQWRHRNNDHGQPVSVVEPIAEKGLQAQIRDLLRQKENLTQVNFV